MRLTLIQMNSRAAARDENVERACAFVDEAARQHPDIVVLPEFFNVEYFPQYRDYRYLDYAETEDGYTQTRMKEKARQHAVHIVSTCNHVGQEGEWVMSGKSMIVDPVGKILIQASGTVEQVVSAEIERESVIRARQRFLLARDRRPDAYGAITTITERLHG